MRVTWAERRGNEVFVFVRGQLVMKRWFRDGQTAYAVLFQRAPAFTYILAPEPA